MSDSYRSTFCNPVRCWVCAARCDALELGALLVMPLVNPFLRGPREAFRGISAKTVGTAIVGAVRSGRRGVQRYTYDGIEALARLKSVRIIPLSTRRRPATQRGDAIWTDH